MSVIETIIEKTKALPGERLAEVLDFIEFLSTRERADAERREWAEHSAANLARAYGPEDSIYDEE